VTMESLRDLSTEDSGRRYVREQVPFWRPRRCHRRPCSTALPQAGGGRGRGPGPLGCGHRHDSWLGLRRTGHSLSPDRYRGAWISDEPTIIGDATHVAFTLVALHRPSVRNAPMHMGGHPLGTAAADDETFLHLRSPIRQLVDSGVAVNDGLPADDTVRLRGLGGPDRGRGRFGREFLPHFSRPTTIQKGVPMARTVMDVHILRTVAPSNRNANATAWPTSTLQGGVRRIRDSIERNKCFVRAEFERAFVDSAIGGPSVRTGQAIAEPLMAIPPGFRDQAAAVARTVLTAANLVEEESNKTHAESPPQGWSAAWAAREGGTK
jgi:hypothetical protein